MASPIKLNLATFYLNFITQAVIGFFINPLLLGALGATGFGIWKSCQRFFDVATAADGGTPQALKWVLAQKSADNDDAAKQREVGAAIAVWLIWLPILILISVVLTYFLPSLINGLGPEESDTTRWVGVILSANVVLTGLVSIPTSVLLGVNQGYWAMSVATLVVIVSNMGMLAASWMGYGVPGIAFVVLATAVLGGLATWLIARRTISWWGLRKPAKADAVRLAKFSGWLLIWSYVQRLLMSSEIILLSALVGAVAVSDYSFTAYVAQFGLSVCLLTTSVFMPSLGRSMGMKDGTAVRSAIAQARSLNLVIAMIVGGGILLFNRSFVVLWAGEASYMGDPINVAMVLAFVQLALIRCDAQILDAALKVRARAIVGMVSTIASLAVAALAYTLTQDILMLFAGIIVGRAIASIAFPMLVLRLEGGISRSLVLTYAATTLVLACCYALGEMIQADNWVALVAYAIVGGAVLAAIGLVLLPHETRVSIMSFRKPLPRATS